MKSYKFEGYTMILQDLGMDAKQGKHRVSYIFANPDGHILFQNKDLFASPMHKPEGYESAKALLSFLTLREHDTDEEYFENYTLEQLAFRDSTDCENLQLYTLDD